MSQNKYRAQLLEAVLQFLWTQWTTLGVAGQKKSEANRVIDPEALLCLSLSFTRYDQRLFDEILDWLSINEKFINVQRLRTIIKKEGFEGTRVLAAIASFLDKKNTTPKWAKLAKEVDEFDKVESLFYLKNGRPLPVLKDRDENFASYGFSRNKIELRGLSQTFPVGNHSNLLLQLRSLFGVGARAEVMLNLLLNDKQTTAEICRAAYYSQKSITDALIEMRHSGLIHYPKSKRSRWYRINSEPFLTLLLIESGETPKAVSWAPFFRSLEMIFTLLNAESFNQLSNEGQELEFQRLMNESCMEKIESAGFGELFITSKMETLLDKILSVLGDH